MLTSLALIFISGLISKLICDKIHIPALIGMMLSGMLIGPFAFNLLSDSLLNIAGDLRTLALVIILTRAGLTLKINDLKQVGRPAFLLCFIPACFEILAITLLAPMFLQLTWQEAALMGSVLAAVSPAIIVPRMLKLIEEGYGSKNKIPQMILAGASADDIFVIVIFNSLLTLVQSDNIHITNLIDIPISIISGIIIGILTGYLILHLFQKISLNNTIQIILIISISLLLLELENILFFSMSGLLAIMSMAMYISSKRDSFAKEICNGYNKLWTAAEIWLFVLVGASVNLSYALNAGIIVITLIILALVVRIIGVLCCIIKTTLTKKEKVFCMIAYTPKATVQAAIGAIPLTIGLSCGDQILTAAVISILISAPIGAFLIDHFHQKLLIQQK